MSDLPRRMLWLIILFEIGSFFFFFIEAIIGYQSKEVLPAFYWRWIWNQATLNFILAIIPVQCAAILVAWSVPAGRTRRRPTHSSGLAPLYRLVSSSLVTLLVLTLVFSGFSEGLRPYLSAERSAILYQSQLARRLYASYETAYATDKLDTAREYLSSYRKLAPSDPAGQASWDRLLIRIEQEKARRVGAPPGQKRSGPVENASIAELIRIAQAYLSRHDYASARYYATLVAGIAPNNAEAARIASASLAGLTRIHPNPQDLEESYYFALKEKGRRDFEEGDPKAAYYIFKSLEATHPDDPDVITYLKRTTEQLARFSFFHDEIDRAAPYPGLRDLVFLNRKQEGVSEILSIRKTVVLPEGIYFEGIEAIGFTNTGRVVYHLAAPYGKLIGSNINMDCIGRTRAVSYLPTMLEGVLPGKSPNALPLEVPISDLSLFSARQPDLSGSALPELWHAGPVLERYGYLKEPVQIEILRRVLSPFGLLILSMFAMGIGWSLRAPLGRPRLPAYVLVPLFPFVVYLITESYFFLSKTIFGFVLIAFGLTVALVALVIVQFVLLFAAIAYLAGQSSELLTE